MNETGRVIMESAILTAVVVISVSLFTFRAARKRRDSTFPTRIIFGGFVVLLVFIVIQVLFILLASSQYTYPHLNTKRFYHYQCLALNAYPDLYFIIFIVFSYLLGFHYLLGGGLWIRGAKS